MTDQLVCRNVGVRYDAGFPLVLSGIDLHVEAGEKVALVGLNGTGKTTLLLSLVGLLPHEGEIEIAGELLTPSKLEWVRRQVGFLFNVPEDQLLFSDVLEDVAFGLGRLKTGRAEAQQRARRMLDRLGVGQVAGTSVHQLSHGQKQRVALAGSLVSEPSVLLLDEPTAGLDPPGAVELGGLLSGLDAAQLIATHDLAFAERVCSRVLLLEGGTLSAADHSFDSIRRIWQL